MGQILIFKKVGHFPFALFLHLNQKQTRIQILTSISRSHIHMLLLLYIKETIWPPLTIKSFSFFHFTFLQIHFHVYLTNNHSPSFPFSFLHTQYFLGTSISKNWKKKIKMMHPLPPPPPYKPPPLKETKPSLYQIVLSKQGKNQQNSTPEETFPSSSKLFGPREQPILRKARRTNPLIWFAAILCLLFSLLLIFFGIATLIIFVHIKPRSPVFDTPAASLSVIYFDSPEFMNGDLTFLANFSNPNKKLNVRFEYLYVELYFSESLIATRALQQFSQKPGEVRLVSVHLLSSLVYLPPNLALDLQKQDQRNRVIYHIKGTFRVKVKMGLVHYSYWLHGRCQIEMTSPPNGVLITHSCRTKR